MVRVFRLQWNSAIGKLVGKDNADIAAKAKSKSGRSGK
jgi:hypothetical protein